MKMREYFIEEIIEQGTGNADRISRFAFRATRELGVTVCKQNQQVSHRFAVMASWRVGDKFIDSLTRHDEFSSFL
jgi:hypothetical protein